MSNHVVVLVLGDVGRSPRMQYHGRSFSKMVEVDRVTIVGYKGERPLEELQTNPKVHFQYLSTVDLPALRGLSLLRAIIKGLIMILTLFTCLLSIPRYTLIVIQNPPSLPAVIVAYAISVFNGSKIMIDWHNLGFSIYESALGKSTTLVKFSYFLEKFICSNFAHQHICVSNALKDWLLKHFGVHASVLYDRPGSVISQKNFNDMDRHQLLLKLDLTSKSLFDNELQNDVAKEKEEETIQTYFSGTVQRKQAQDEIKTALIVSSTSWTPDEDFSILLQSLENLENYLQINAVYLERFLFQRAVCVVTGKGELKALYEKKMESFNASSRYVKLRTKWLEFSDYPKLLYCSDLGISLHTSTSGLDLPMKILDMFGSSLPVVALEFPTIFELVKVDSNGYVFQTHENLLDLFKKLLFSEDARVLNPLQKLRQHCQHLDDWDTNWTKVIPPICFKHFSLN